MDEKKVREAIELIKERIRILEEIGSHSDIIKKHIELYNTAIEALEKQLPKKPIVYSEYKGGIDFNCPDCGRNFLAYKDDMIYCPYCACKFDWSEC